MKTKTLFILGAGASAPYGLPLGKELVDAIAKIIRELPASAESAGHNLRLTERKFYQMKLDELANRLALSRAPTIDSFLADSSHDRLKEAMIAAIWKAEDEAILAKSRPAEDWLGWLFYNRFNRDPDMFSENQFAVASFNYDRLPEALLSQMMANLFQIPIRDAHLKVTEPLADGADRFFHIHGAINCDLEPANDRNANATRWEWGKTFSEHNLVHASQGVKTIFDGHESVQKTITNYIHWADRIFIIGIGYHQQMRDLFPRFTKKSTFRAYDGSESIGDTDKCWTSTKDFVGGTGRKLSEFDRKNIDEWSHSRLTLAPSDQDTISFLSENLPPEA